MYPVPLTYGSMVLEIFLAPATQGPRAAKQPIASTRLNRFPRPATQELTEEVLDDVIAEAWRDGR